MARPTGPKYRLYLGLAETRVQRILTTHVVASRRTLESKIAEAGPRDQRVPPHVIGHALKNLQRHNKVLSLIDSGKTAFYCLASSIKTAPSVLREKVALESKFSKSTSGPGKPNVGSIAERVLKNAFTASPSFSILGRWGDVEEHNGITAPTKSDGIIVCNELPPSLKTTDAVAVVEIKNRREWVYPDSPDLWKLIRNAFLFDVVGVFLARRIHGTLFRYGLRNVGAVGVETFCQFAPKSLEADLAAIKDKNGLGYHDLDFSEAVPPYLQVKIDKLPTAIFAARLRMAQVRSVVTPYFPILTDQSIRQSDRFNAYQSLISKLKNIAFPPKPRSPGRKPRRSAKSASP